MTKDMLRILPRLLERTDTEQVLKYLAWNMSREEAIAMRRLLELAEKGGCPRTMKNPRGFLTGQSLVKAFDQRGRERQAKSPPHAV